jgi:hypothetical protein
MSVSINDCLEAIQEHMDNVKKHVPDDDFTLFVTFTKTDISKRMAYGWASVIEKDGEQVVDHEGDVISESELIKAAQDFMINYRQSKDLHLLSSQDGLGNVGEVVESIILTKDIQKALGIDLNQVGWFIGVKISDEGVLQKVKSGEYAAFSIGGSGVREPIYE